MVKLQWASEICKTLKNFTITQYLGHRRHLVSYRDVTWGSETCAHANTPMFDVWLFLHLKNILPLSKRVCLKSGGLIVWLSFLWDYWRKLKPDFAPLTCWPTCVSLVLALCWKVCIPLPVIRAKSHKTKYKSLPSVLKCVNWIELNWNTCSCCDYSSECFPQPGFTHVVHLDRATNKKAYQELSLKPPPNTSFCNFQNESALNCCITAELAVSPDDTSPSHCLYMRGSKEREVLGNPARKKLHLTGLRMRKKMQQLIRSLLACLSVLPNTIAETSNNSDIFRSHLCCGKYFHFQFTLCKLKVKKKKKHLVQLRPSNAFQII